MRIFLTILGNDKKKAKKIKNFVKIFAKKFGIIILMY